VSQGRRPLGELLVDTLIDSGTWMTREDLHVQLPDHSDVAMDDAIADLVIEGKADWRENVGYRLAGAPVARRAAQRLHRAPAGTKRFSLAIRLNDGFHIGVAEERADLGRVMYELALPPAAPGEDELDHLQRQVEGVLHFMDAEVGDGSSV
jgi:hypothetical protein